QEGEDRGGERVRRRLVLAPVDLAHGTKNILARVWHPRTRCRFRSPVLVGFRCHHPDFLHQLVGGLPQRLALSTCAGGRQICYTSPMVRKLRFSSATFL